MDRGPQLPTQPAAAGQSLRRRFDLAITEVTIGGHDYQLLRPRNVDDLISEEDFALDERIPYWADCWPSARVLAERVASLAGQARTCLELGCGIGLVSLAAARAGFEVLATDYYADALEFTAANAELHAIHALDTRLVDWRKTSRRPGHVRSGRGLRRVVRGSAGRAGRVGVGPLASRGRTGNRQRSGAPDGRVVDRAVCGRWAGRSPRGPGAKRRRRR